MQNITPQEYGLLHDSFRTHQLEAIQWAMQIPPSQFAAINAPTGSGKTAFAAACGSRAKTIALVALKSLQDQYLEYDFVKMTGKSNHPCVSEDRLFSDATADDCLHPTMMWECSDYDCCPYVLARTRAMKAPRAILNYPYWNNVGKQVRGNGLAWRKRFLFLDEAHELPRIVVDNNSIEIDNRNRDYYQFDAFPLIHNGMPQRMKGERAFPWLRSCDTKLARLIAKLNARMKKSSESKRRRLAGTIRGAERIKRKISSVYTMLLDVPDDWFMASGPEGFTLKPLTARYIFPHLFTNFDRRASVVAMSATIGDFGDFAEEVGVENPHTRRVPSRFPPESRPVYVYQDTPRMSAKATGDDFETQADIIAAAIAECPEHWSGLIHVTRKKEAGLLVARLAARGLSDRVWAMPGHDGDYVPTSDQVDAWNERRGEVPNSICVAWCLWAGYDGRDERICIVAKVPFNIWGSDGTYEAAWRSYSMSRYNWDAANKLMQGVGRTRRGREQDYDLDGATNGFVAIMDGSFDNRTMGKLNEEVREAIVYV